MSDFRCIRRVDAAYCTMSTFRHLLTEEAARNHLHCIADSLRPGGIYVLGLHLLSSDGGGEDTERWTQRRGGTKVIATTRVLRIDLRRRIENLRICLLVRRDSKELRVRYEYQFRTYTARQFQQLLRSVPSLELYRIYDFWSAIDQPIILNDKVVYGVFVLRRRLQS